MKAESDTLNSEAPSIDDILDNPDKYMTWRVKQKKINDELKELQTQLQDILNLKDQMNRQTSIITMNRSRKSTKGGKSRKSNRKTRRRC